MNLEASIVERLQKLRQWQLEQQERLLKQQQMQREMLTQKQDCIFKALELSIQELDINEDTLSKSNLNDIVEAVEFDKRDLNIQSQTKENGVHALNDSGLYDNQDINNSFYSIMSQQQSLDDKLRKNSITSHTKHLNDKALCDTKCNVKVIVNTPEEEMQMEQFQMDGVAPFTPDKSLTKRICIDDVPIPSPRKDFQTLLEERLKDCENEFSEKSNVKKQIEKKPFLRKGEGLSRFKLNTSISSPNAKQLNRSLSNKKFKCSSIDKRSNKNAQRSKAAQLPKSMHVKKNLNLKNVPLPKKKIRNKSQSTAHLEDSANESKETIESNTVDFQSGTQKELEEVRIFELLEEKAENSSFCSTSSAVIAFLQQSTPFKMKTYGYKAESMGIGKQFSPVSKDKTTSKPDQAYKCTTPSKNTNAYSSLLPFINENLSELYRNMLLQSANEIVMPEDDENKDALLNTQIHSTNNQQNLYNAPTNPSDNEADVGLHVRFSEYNEYKTIGLTDTSSMSTDSVVTRSFQDDKVWSDFSTPETSIMETPQKYDDTIESNDFMCNAKISQYTYHKDESNPSNANQNFNGKGNYNDRDLSTPTKSNIHSNKLLDIKKRDNNKEDVIVIKDKEDTKNFEDTNETIFKSELLKNRLLELEQEINIFRKENIALSMQRKKLQEDYRNMHKEFSEKEKNFEEYRKQTEDRLQEEKKKLAREKAALENRMRDSQEKAQQNKLERQEVQNLKEAMEKLMQEMHIKESRWNAAQSRHKCQMRILKVENTKLKEEVERLQSLKKSNIKNKGKPGATNTRAIHQINKLCNMQLKQISKMNNSSSDEDEKLKPMKTVSTVNVQIVEAGKEQHNNDNESVNEKPRTSHKSITDVAKKRNLYANLIKEATYNFAESQAKFTPLENSNGSAGELRTLTDITSTISNKCATESFIIKENYKKPSLESEEPNSNIENLSPNQNIDKQSITQLEHPDGTIEFKFTNGNIKKIFPDQGLTKLMYYNGDIRETSKDGTVKYFYASTGTWHTTMPDGLEILEFADGQIERRSVNGTVEVSFPDGSVRILESNGIEKWTMPDGTLIQILTNGEKILTFPNGQREVHTKSHKRREYPDGTIKVIYPDGTQETRYSNGRVRVKDKDGNLLMDSYQ